jgi:Outer membrane protein beta-barrel domain
MHNRANTLDDPIYQPQATISYGGGFSFLHHLNNKKSHGPIRHGALSSHFKVKKSIRFDLLYTEHNQKFVSQYRLSGGGVKTHEGKKRLAYLKVPVFYEVTFPINKKMSFSVYGGPQFSFLTKAQGGLVYYIHYADHDYFDLPFSNRDYFKKITADAAGGFHLELSATRWMHLLVGMRFDYTLTTVENKTAIINNYPVYGTDELRTNGRNTALALVFGINYQFHKAEFDRTRF